MDGVTTPCGRDGDRGAFGGAPVGHRRDRPGDGRARRVGEDEEARRHARRGGLAGAVPGGRLRIGRADQRAGRRRRAERRRRTPGSPAPMPTPASTSTTRASTRHRRSRAVMGGAHGSRRLRVRVRPPRPADERGRQQHPRGQLEQDGQRHVGELRERERGRALDGAVLRRPSERRLARHRVARDGQREAPRRRVPGVDGPGRARCRSPAPRRKGAQHGLPARDVGRRSGTTTSRTTGNGVGALGRRRACPRRSRRPARRPRPGRPAGRPAPGGPC